MFLLDTNTGDPLLNWLVNNASAVGVLAFVVVALLRGWLVTGRELTRVVEERDKALDLVYAQAQATQRALEVAEKQKADT